MNSVGGTPAREASAGLMGRGREAARVESFSVLRRLLVAIGFAAVVAAAPTDPVHAQSDGMFVDQFEDPPQQQGPCAPPGYSRGIAPLTLHAHWIATSGTAIGAALVPIHIDQGTYLSFRFDRAMFGAFSTLFQINADTSNTGGVRGADVRYVTVSQCEGGLDTQYALPQGCARFANEGPFMYLNFDVPMNNQYVCDLDPTRDYYINFVLEDPSDGWQPGQACNSAFASLRCGFRIQVNPL